MDHGWRSSGTEAHTFGALVRHDRVRLIDGGATGCLLETSRPLAVGTIGTLRVRLDDREFSDVIQVVRCVSIGESEAYHVGTKFVSTTPPYAASLRHRMRCQDKFAGWLETDVPQ